MLLFMVHRFSGGSSECLRTLLILNNLRFAYFFRRRLATGRAVVACPGGGYSHLAVDHEGYDWAPYFNKQGIALIVLKYRMPNGDRTLPISDAEAAMKIVRDSADVWNLNPRDIGIMGSSAGGHLASTIATHAKPELRPDFQILFYPVITMDKSYTHMVPITAFWVRMLLLSWKRSILMRSK